MKNRLRGRRNGLQLESLERRRTPTVSAAAIGPAAVVSAALEATALTSPGDGAVVDVADSPRELILHLGRDVSVWSDDSVKVERIEADGSVTAIALDVDGGEPVTVDYAAGTATLNLVAPLPAGRYRFVVGGGTLLSATLSRGAWDPAEDHVLSEFGVKKADLFAGATDLGVLGPDVEVVPGSLTGTGDQAAYRIKLDGSQPLWRLGLQLDAERIGSPLKGSLTVYDLSGNVVAAKTPGESLPLANPNDPYLFTGLAPGDYYVVVSGGSDVEGGAFQLNLVADPAGDPTRVVSVSLSRSNGAVNGFSITFSSPIDPARLTDDAIQVVDAQGRKFSVKFASIKDGLVGATYKFREPLPEGEYRLVAASDAAPLADLLGRVPIAYGLPDGTLARWSVSSGADGSGATDSSPDEFEIVTLAPGASETFTLLVDGSSIVSILTAVRSGGLKFELIQGDVVTVLEPGGSGDGSYSIDLPGGVYTIRLTSVGDAPAMGSWSVYGAHVNASSIFGNAVGPGGVIGLRLGGSTTSPPTGPAAPGGTSSSVSSVSSQTIGATPSHTGAGASGLWQAGPSPWGTGSAGTAPVGRPSTSTNGLSAIGPTVPGGQLAVAWAGPGFSDRGLASSLVLSTSLQADDGRQRGPAGTLETASSAPIRDDSSVAAAVAREADGRALLRADRIVEALRGGVQWAFDGFGRSSGTVDATPGVDAAAAAAALADLGADDPNGGPSRGEVERSALDLPVGILFVTAATVQLRRGILRWWRRRAAPTASQNARPIYRGPRRMSRPDARHRLEAERLV